MLTDVGASPSSEKRAPQSEKRALSSAGRGPETVGDSARRVTRAAIPRQAVPPVRLGTIDLDERHRLDHVDRCRKLRIRKPQVPEIVRDGREDVVAAPGTG